MYCLTSNVATDVMCCLYFFRNQLRNKHNKNTGVILTGRGLYRRPITSREACGSIVCLVLCARMPARSNVANKFQSKVHLYNLARVLIFGTSHMEY
jgi:hypothetical protein